MSYCIGLDCGIASVGYSVIELNGNEEPFRIIRLGSRVFSEAENHKTGASLAAPRREARSQRRRLRRHRHRNERIRNLIIENQILSEEELMSLFDGQLSDIYELRTAALDRLLTRAEFARVLINLAQRRGFKSNRKVDSEDKENGKLLQAVDSNRQLLAEKGYRTIGEMFYKDPCFAEHKRNKGGDYSSTVSRAMVEDEIHQIFSYQRSYGLDIATESTQDDYTAIVMSQRSFDVGPGGNSKYGGNQIDKMIGSCTLIPENKRAAKAAYSFQLFTLWQNINNIKIISSGKSRALTSAERILIEKLAHESASLKYTKLRKELKLCDDEYFSTLSYTKASTSEVEDKAKFEYLTAYHAIRKTLDKVKKGRILSYSIEQLDEIGRIFTVYKNDAKIEELLTELGIESIDICQLLKLSGFSKFGHISVEACSRLLPYLKEGMHYNEACDAAGFMFKGHFSVPARVFTGT